MLIKLKENAGTMVMVALVISASFLGGYLWPKAACWSECVYECNMFINKTWLSNPEACYQSAITGGDEYDFSLYYNSSREG